MLWFRFALLQVNVLSLVSSFPFLWATFMVHRALVFKLQLKCILFLCAFHWCCLFIFLLNFACIYFDYKVFVAICTDLNLSPYQTVRINLRVWFCTKTAQKVPTFSINFRTKNVPIMVLYVMPIDVR